MFAKLKEKWLRVPLKKKYRIFIGLFLLSLFLVAIPGIYSIHSFRYEYGKAMNELSKVENADHDLNQEINAFQQYLNESQSLTLDQLNEITKQTQYSIDHLPLNYANTSADRYAATWDIRNGYTNYSTARDNLLAQKDSTNTSDQLTKIFHMQQYLKQNIERLSRLTVADSAKVYEERTSMISILTILFIVFLIIGFLISIIFARMINDVVFSPVNKLAKAAQEITDGKYDIEDIHVPNEDELGQLVKTFNKMKDSLQMHIQTLMENQRLEQQVHEEEIERVNTEKQLANVKLDLLRSQVNPHFLFNTLNTIQGVIELDDPETAGKMINALSNLFHYSLKTTGRYTTLKSELKIIQDYLYLQKIRFSDRLQYDIDIHDVNIDEVVMPVFILQPIVENAVIHGIVKKVDGGNLHIEVSKYLDGVQIIIQDSGIGMDEKQLNDIRVDMQKHSHTIAGIGLGNLKSRLDALYKDVDITIDSELNKGTIIHIQLAHRRSVL